MWSLANIAVVEGGRRFYAKALYNTGGTPDSNVRLFTVVAAMKPSITSAKDPQNVEIPHNTSTTATTVTLAGEASNGQQVEIFDGTVPKGTATASASGDWTHQVTGLSVTTHNFTAKGLYGSNPVSAARTLTVWDLTTFDGRDWNNWEISPTADGEFNVRLENNSFYLDFVTPRSAVARYVLLKLISGLEVGATYEFSLDSVALQTSENKPEINLMSPQGLSAAGVLTNVWKNIAGSFLATSREMRLGIVFWPFGDFPHTHSGFKLDNILIKQIQKNDAVESN
jgi:hypothetical protein